MAVEGNVVARVATVKEELKEFIDRNEKEKTKKPVNTLPANKWITKLYYLSGTFSRIMAANKSLQG